MYQISTNYFQQDLANIDKKLDKLQSTLGTPKWWEILGLIISVFSLLVSFFVPSTSGWWPLSVIGLCVFLALIYRTIRKHKPLIFIPDEMQSFWSHAPQPDGRKLTQIKLDGHVTNTSAQSLYLANISLISPRTDRTHSKFIFTYQQNRLDDSDRPILPWERRGFDGHFFVEGFLGTPGKPMTIVVSITDNLGRRYRVKFPNIRRAEER